MPSSPSRRLVAVLVALGALSACAANLTAFVVPPLVAPNRVFEIVVRGSWFGINGSLGAVLQLPVGFTVIAAAHDVGSATVVRDAPAVLGIYTAEPGHYLASWSGSSIAVTSSGDATLVVFVRAPATATTATCKVSLCGMQAGQPFAATSPASVTNFAQLTAPAHVRTVQVTVQRGPSFVREGDGLGNPVAYSWSGVALDDFDGDGDDDLAAYEPGTGSRVWRSTPGWGWLASHPPSLAGGPAGFVAFGDFDGDGHRDLAEGVGRVFYGDGAGNWTAGPFLAPWGGGRGVASGDIDHDGRDDLVLGSATAGVVQAWLGNANRTFTAASNGLPNQTGVPPDGGHELLLRDVTGDGELDIVWTRVLQANVWAGDGHGNWTPGSGLAGLTFHGADAADLNGDGTLELLFGVRSGGGALVFQHLGGNTWVALTQTGLPATGSGRAVATLDFDRDGDLDVAIGFAAPGGVELWENQTGMSFAPLGSLGLPAGSLFGVDDLAAGDVNGDTFPDLAAALPAMGFGVWQNWRTGPSPFGTGCQGTLAQPLVVRGNGAPALGTAGFAVEVAGGQPATLGFTWLGASKRHWSGAPVLPLELTLEGAPGCTLLAAPDAVRATLFDAAGVVAYPLPIPAVPALLRTTVFAQGASFAPGSNPLALAFSAGLALRLE